MAAALPYCDAFESAHTLRAATVALDRLLTEGALSSRG